MRSAPTALLFLAVAAAPAFAAPPVFFDDFTYGSRAQLGRHGWCVRTASGWPGIAGAVWRPEDVTFEADPRDAANRVLCMTSRTGGPGGTVWQTQICQRRKFKDGTYGARVHFSTRPLYGPAGDGVVESFYTISPLAAPMDPDYSEVDFEYLPAGGWGAKGPALFTTTWYTYSPEPHWKKVNVFHFDSGDKAGWHTLVVQMMDGTVTYFIDGRRLARHGGRYYPRVPMSISFNLWFIREAVLPSRAPRAYQEKIDWVYFEKDVRLAPAAVQDRVSRLRAAGVSFRDTVPAPNPPLPSPCNS